MTSPTSKPLRVNSCNSWTSPDCLALGSSDLATASVERDAEGVPTAWRLLRTGANPITRAGASFGLDLAADDINQIVARHQAKGSKIPIDSRHWLFKLAEAKGVSESEALKHIPDGRLALGFGGLEARPDGLWLANVDYVPAAKKLVQEGVFRYFSPVIRGLADGKLRVTSVAMENEPALNNLDSLAASAEDAAPIIDFEQALNQQRSNRIMNQLASLALALGHDVLDLTAEGVVPGLLEKAKKVKAAADLGEALLAKLKGSLALGAEDGPEQLIGHVLGLAVKAKSADDLKAKVDALALAAETAKRDVLIQDGLKSGKLTNALVKDFVPDLSNASLAKYLATVSPNDAIALSELDRSKLKTDGGATAPTPEEETMSRKLGVTPEMRAAAAKTGK